MPRYQRPPDGCPKVVYGGKTLRSEPRMRRPKVTHIRRHPCPADVLTRAELAAQGGVCPSTLKRYIRLGLIEPLPTTQERREEFFSLSAVERVKALRHTPEPREGVEGLMTLRRISEACGVSYDALKSRAKRGKMEPRTASGKGLDVFYDPRDVPEMAQAIGGNND